jgi:glycosyltransferase involved in cell wall biosynthesis
VVQGDPQDLFPSPGSICIVANDFDYVMRNGGIGTYNWLLAHLLAEHDWRVHVLYCGTIRERAEMLAVAGRLTENGIGWSYLEDFIPPPVSRVPGVTDILNTELSEKVRYALEELHDEHHFDLIEFGEWGGLGFRPIQAKRTGLAFQDVRMAVKLHSSSQWMREGNHQWLAACAELEVDFCERYAFENADLQLSPTRYMLDYARQNGWNVRADAQVLPYPYPAARFIPPGSDSASPQPVSEIVFFGRLETRKGLEIFVEAINKLDTQVPITFLGRVNVVGNHLSALDYLRWQLAGRRFRLLTDYNREQALQYLSQNNRLAVIASLSDNSPFTVIECALNGIPFIASRVGGIPELLPDQHVQEHLLFNPEAKDLLRCLQQYLHTDPVTNARICQRLRASANVSGNNRQVVQGYRQALTSPSVVAVPSDSPVHPDPLVTVVIPYYNLEAHLPLTLSSLAEQTYTNLEVLVINDGSTAPEAVEVFEEEQARYPQFRFLHQENAGIGATRNRGLAEAQGEYFICVDADNVARTDMVERMVRAMQRNPGLSALSCFYLAFEEDEDLDVEEYAYAYRPTGGPHVLGSYKNVYGDANSIFRTEVFRSVGGFEVDRDTSWEDWEAFVKLIHAGHRVDVIPDYLFFYRHLQAGFSRVTKQYLNQRRVLRQFIRMPDLPTAERIGLWTALTSLQRNNEAMQLRMYSLRYRIADRVHDLFVRVPSMKRGMKWILLSGERVLNYLTTRTG